jgi:hypothetical protein
VKLISVVGNDLAGESVKQGMKAIGMVKISNLLLHKKLISYLLEYRIYSDT